MPKFPECSDHRRLERLPPSEDVDMRDMARQGAPIAVIPYSAQRNDGSCQVRAQAGASGTAVEFGVGLRYPASVERRNATSPPPIQPRLWGPDRGRLPSAARLGTRADTPLLERSLHRREHIPGPLLAGVHLPADAESPPGTGPAARSPTRG